MRALLIAEKPNLMRDIQKVYKKMSYKDEIDFMALQGHILELKSPDEYKEEWGKPWKISVLPMIPDFFDYKVKKEHKKLFSDIKKAVESGKYDYIINACDAGREGELIFYSLYKKLKTKLPVKRFWASDTTELTIKNSLNHLLDDKDPNLVRLKYSAQYRAYFDWLIGINLSRAFSLKTRQLIPVGRVMTPTLAIVVNRELEIQNFKPQDYYEIEGDFRTYKGIWFNPENNESRIFDKKKAEKIIKSLSSQGIVESVQQKKEKNHPPTLHSLLELQKEANQIYGYTADRTLDIAQVLYEKKKLITYPRTESRHLPKNMSSTLIKHIEAVEGVPEVSKFVKSILKDKNRINQVTKDKRYVDDSKVTDHHAIIPTQNKANVSSLSKDEYNIYLLIVKRFISIFLDPMEANKTTIITRMDQEHFKTNGKTILKLGYMELYKDTMKKQEDFIPPVKKGDKVPLKEAKLLEKQTTPPSRYTDATLLQAMQNAGKFVEEEELKKILKEKAGLGTSATRHQIIKKLINYKMMARKGKIIYPTKFGIHIIQTIHDRDIASPQLTGTWEQKLKKIEDGLYEPKDFYKEMIQYTEEATNDFKENIKGDFGFMKGKEEKSALGSCPKCGSDVMEGKSYYLCTQYKKSCDFIIPKEFGNAKITKTEVKKLLNGKETKELHFKWKSGKEGKGKLILDENGKLSFANAGDGQLSSHDEIGTCPKCGKKVIEGKNFYLCEGYKNSCDFIVNKEIRGTKIAKTDMKKMLQGKSTKIMKFEWKNGKQGKARLHLNDGKLEFEFVNDEKE